MIRTAPFLACLCLALSLALPGGADAQTADAGAPVGPLMVVGLHSDDMLVMREGPDVLAKAIGWIAFDARDVMILEVSADGTWGRVAREGREGWVAMRHLKPVGG
jgi:hypothetical protein